MEHHEVLIVGGGNAGISLAARLLRDGATGVTVVAPQPVHRYRPLLNYVGAGEASMSDLDRPMRDVMPDGCAWVRDSVVAVDPSASHGAYPRRAHAALVDAGPVPGHGRGLGGDAGAAGGVPRRLGRPPPTCRARLRRSGRG